VTRGEHETHNRRRGRDCPDRPRRHPRRRVAAGSATGALQGGQYYRAAQARWKSCTCRDAECSSTDVWWAPQSSSRVARGCGHGLV